MEQNGTGCKAHEAPILCANNCGFFGTAATMNMCSKCYKDLMLKEENEKIAASSIGSILNGSSNTIVKKSDDSADVDGSSNTTIKKSDVLVDVDSKSGSLEPQVLSTPTSSAAPLNETEKPKEGSTRCNTCRKRVGLTGFRCRCGDLFCSAHRYSDKHECTYDYRTAAQDAIAKANPVVKAQKLDKI